MGVWCRYKLEYLSNKLFLFSSLFLTYIHRQARTCSTHMRNTKVVKFIYFFINLYFLTVEKHTRSYSSCSSFSLVRCVLFFFSRDHKNADMKINRFPAVSCLKPIKLLILFSIPGILKNSFNFSLVCAGKQMISIGDKKKILFGKEWKMVVWGGLILSFRLLWVIGLWPFKDGLLFDEIFILFIFECTRIKRWHIGWEERGASKILIKKNYKWESKVI